VTARRPGTGTFIPISYEGFRYAYGRSPTEAEIRACRQAAQPEPVRPKLTNGCDCFDPECYVCTDDEGEARTDNIREVPR
jgi:hypothetical protein